MANAFVLALLTSASLIAQQSRSEIRGSIVEAPHGLQVSLRTKSFERIARIDEARSYSVNAVPDGEYELIFTASLSLSCRTSN